MEEEEIAISARDFTEEEMEEFFLETIWEESY